MAKPVNKRVSQGRGAQKRQSKKGASTNLKLSLALVAALLMVIAGVLTFRDDDDSSAGGSRAEQLVRPDSLKLATGSTDAVVVEFLDFECEACKAAKPSVDALKAKYGDRVSFVIRHMPLHSSSINAAKTAEAAAAQGKFEAMYNKLYETQPEWGEQRTPERAKFFTYATELGLDMAAFEKVFNDPATEAKIRRDQADGRALEVQGTPTFFFNGDQLPLPQIEPRIERTLAS